VSTPQFLMTDPGHFDVCYQINPWMDPAAWSDDRPGLLARARAGSNALKRAIQAEGGTVSIVPAAPGLPDLVFPANAAIVLDGVVLLARFRHPERQGEEAVFSAVFEALRDKGLVREIAELPQGIFQEGAGDCIWDATRQLFWAGYGPRSSAQSLTAIAKTFGQPVRALELASERFYHLDTCLCPLSGGEILYYPPAFTAAALRTLHDTVPADLLIEATDADATAFCVNAVNIDRTIIMAQPPADLRQRFAYRGYKVVPVDLSPFMLSGGAAYCMTLRLDRHSASAASGVSRPEFAMAGS
jgi:N-dimethylarginine dimethylaminohydrolase